jgi:ethanolamine ammonia-lyase small subunit
MGEADSSSSFLEGQWPELAKKIRERTPARLLVGRSGASYRTATQLQLRRAHADAVDAVHTELDLDATLGKEFVRRWNLFEVSTQAASKSEYLLRPDLGRSLHHDGRELLRRRCATGVDLQIAIGDGLSVTAVAAQAPGLLPLLYAGAEQRGWRVGQTFVIRSCRVGVLNDIGELLFPKVAVLLIGERPGLATAESLSAYMAHAPRQAHTDADRNLISNIHSHGISHEEASRRILDLAAQMMLREMSGSRLKEERPSLR